MTSPTAAPRLLVQLRHAIRLHQYSPRTEEAYTGWVRRFVRFNGMRHPSELGAPEVTRFLTHLASAGRVSASTQTQALSALLFLYPQLMRGPLGRRRHNAANRGVVVTAASRQTGSGFASMRLLTERQPSWLGCLE